MRVAEHFITSKHCKHLGSLGLILYPDLSPGLKMGYPVPRVSPFPAHERRERARRALQFSHVSEPPQLPLHTVTREKTAQQCLNSLIHAQTRYSKELVLCKLFLSNQKINNSKKGRYAGDKAVPTLQHSTLDRRVSRYLEASNPKSSYWCP